MPSRGKRVLGVRARASLPARPPYASSSCPSDPPRRRDPSGRAAPERATPRRGGASPSPAPGLFYARNERFASGTDTDSSTGGSERGSGD